MSEAEAHKPDYSSLYRPRRYFDTEPFDASAFDYKSFAGRVTTMLKLLEGGAVIAIDAPWGNGKTYFGRNFEAGLKKNGWKTVYIDAFQHDYVEDPFLLLASTMLASAIDKPKKEGFIKAATAVGKALLPGAAKATLKIATAGLLDTDDLADAGKAVSEATGDAAVKLVEERITGFEKDRQSIEAFRKKISELAQSIKDQTGNPLVVFIDELDRCRPDFAVRTLERMKHFFDVPALTFVLLLNKRQLEHAVKGVYGADLDAESYLRRFLHMTLQLPVQSRAASNATSEVGRYPQYLAGKISLAGKEKLVAAFAQHLSELAPEMGLTLRDVERCFMTLVLATINIEFSDRLAPFLAFVVILKVSYPSVYEGLLDRRPQARQEVLKLVGPALEKGGRGGYLGMCDDMLIAHLGEKLGDEQIKGWQQYFFRFNISSERMFSFMASLVDDRTR